MACLWTPQVTLCSSRLCLLLSCITYVRVGVDILKALTCGAAECERVCVPENLGKRGQDALPACLYCISLALSPYQAGSLTKARDPCQAVLDNCMWSECSRETMRDLRKLGLIRNTSTDLTVPVRDQTQVCAWMLVVLKHSYTHFVFDTPAELLSHWPICSTRRPRRPTRLAE